MNNEEYRQLNALAQSDLKLILHSDKHFVNRHRILNRETQAMKLGTAFHEAVCEPEKFKNNYLQLPSVMPNGEPINRRKKAHKEYLEELSLANPDKIALTEDEMDDLTGMLLSLTEHPVANSLFRGGLAEQVKTWKHETWDCKGKCDYFCETHPLLGNKILVELKTAADASPEAFAREVQKRGYDFQAAWYKEGFNADRVITVAVEKVFPYAIGVYDMELWLPNGERKIKLAFEKLKRLEENEGVAYGYTETIDQLSVPNWIASLDE